MNINDSNSPYYRPDKPRSSWELIKWFFFEPTLFEKFNKQVNRWEKLKIYLLFSIQIMFPFSILIYWLSLLVIVSFDIPIFYPELFNGWDSEALFSIKFKFLLFGSFLIFHTLLIIASLSTALVGVIYNDFTVSIGVYFYLSILLYFRGWMGSYFNFKSAGPIYDSIFGVAYGFIVGIAFVPIISGMGTMKNIQGKVLLLINFFFHIIVIMGFFTMFNWLISFYYGIGAGVGIFLSIYRIPFIIIYSLRFYFKSAMQKNPYILDGGIWFTVPWFEDPLIELVKANENEVEISEFINFLSVNRPYNGSLISKLIHSQKSKALATAIQLKPEILNNFFLINFEDDYHPSHFWFVTLGQFESDLKFYSENKDSSPTNLKKILQKLETSLHTLEKQTSLESPKWNHFYFKGLENLRKITSEELERVNQEVESSGFNPYKRGEALNPDFDDLIFKGRQGFKNEIATKVLSSSHMHLLFIQGQRRVGKTSAIKFLEKLLDDQFKVVIQDAQSSASETIQLWLTDLKEKIEKKLKLPNELEKKTFSNNPLHAWNEFRLFVEQVMQEKKFKLLLTIDEYENLHNRIFSKMEHSIAEQILGDIRNFSQHQNQIIFMFVGSALFTELVFYEKDSPSKLKEISRWSNFFPQLVRVNIDYLEEEDSRSLITTPVPDLTYPEKLQKEIWKLTHGHPSLIQYICGELVDLSNRNNKNQVSMEDLKMVIQDKIILRDMSPFNVFWDEFCIEPSMKKTVLNLLAEKANLNPKHVSRLLEHRFIEEYKKGKYCFRVKLFELWLKKYGHL